MGGSIKLWKDFFPNATVVGVDIMKEKEVWDEIRHDRIQLYTERDAYETDFLSRRSWKRTPDSTFS